MVDFTPGFNAPNIASLPGRLLGAPSATQVVGKGNYIPTTVGNIATWGKGAQGGGQVLGTNVTAGSSITPAQQATIDSYDQAIRQSQAALGRLPGQLAQGNSTINSDYQDALQTLLAGKETANRNYNTATDQTKTNYVGAKNTIGSQAGTTLNGLLRLLGSRGAGGGSAATISAPGAVARAATLQRNDVGNTYAQNLQGLDTNWNDYLQGYNTQVSSANKQHENSLADYARQINQGKSDIKLTLADLASKRAQAAGGNPVSAAQPYLDQSNSILDALSNYRSTPYNIQTTPYNAPALSSYTYDQSTPTYQGQTQTNDYYSPSLAALLGKKQQLGVG